MVAVSLKLSKSQVSVYSCLNLIHCQKLDARESEGGGLQLFSSLERSEMCGASDHIYYSRKKGRKERKN